MLCQNEQYDTAWQLSHATWYGEPEGDGSDGGACGFGVLAGTSYTSNIAAGSSPIFKDGEGCGACYQIKCIKNELCKTEPITVVITDLCPGGDFCEGKVHFDLSGTAFGNLAVSGKNSDLRAVGVLDLEYMRVPCSYPGQNVAFQIDPASNSQWLSIVVKYEAGPGNLQLVELQEAGSSTWQSCTRNWGANWSFNGQLKGPLSVRLTSGISGKVLVSRNSIPEAWQPGYTYASGVQITS
ncbi:hypothetical protein O6H91_06G126100 [Diphasiastrum complanatum]|nr:hypothetical protein O6H91_06G126100 [Diphasiastrum complanatum]